MGNPMILETWLTGVNSYCSTLSPAARKKNCVRQYKMGSRSAITSWGPSTWTLYHVVSFNYPDEPTDDQRQKAYDFLYGIAHMLPCVHCRTHWTKDLEEHVQSPFSETLSSRDAFSRFLVSGHNEVNRRLGRPQIPYDIVRDWYTNSRSHERKMCDRAALIVIIVICIVLLRGFVRARSNMCN